MPTADVVGLPFGRACQRDKAAVLLSEETAVGDPKGLTSLLQTPDEAVKLLALLLQLCSAPSVGSAPGVSCTIFRPGLRRRLMGATVQLFSLTIFDRFLETASFRLFEVCLLPVSDVSNAFVVVLCPLPFPPIVDGVPLRLLLRLSL